MCNREIAYKLIDKIDDARLPYIIVMLRDLALVSRLSDDDYELDFIISQMFDDSDEGGF